MPITGLPRRQWLGGSVALGALGLLGACAGPARRTGLATDAPPLIAARADRISRITVCLRPFRAAGPRIETETLASKTVVHHYGHGGSGWSLSWGSAAAALDRAPPVQGIRVGVIGCGAIGLTTALVAQERGAIVTIHAAALVSQARSARASGSWTPSSRIAKASDVTPAFAAQWETMARTSFARYQSMLGLPGMPIEWDRFYGLTARDAPPPAPDPIGFAELDDRIADMEPQGDRFETGDTALPYTRVHTKPNLIFNVASYGDYLLRLFLERGGRLEIRSFNHPSQLDGLPESILFNCTGYGARALWGDTSIVPIRGQIAWLIPQPDALCSLYYRDIYVVSRRDGIVVQWLGHDMAQGYGRTDETADPAEARHAVEVLQSLYRGMGYAARDA